MEVEKFVEELKTRSLEVKEKESIMDIDSELFNKAFQKICTDWNRSDSSREFIKFMIKLFIPLNREDVFIVSELKDEEELRCCILGIKLIGSDLIYALKDKYDESLIIKSTKKNCERLEKEIYEVVRELRKYPIELRTGSTAYKSKYPKSKVLSKEAIIALNTFVDFCKEGGVKEVTSIINKPKRDKEKVKKNTVKKEFKPREDKPKREEVRPMNVNLRIKQSTIGDALDSDIWAKLREGLKK